MEIRVGTFNVLNTSCRYLERKPWIRQSIELMDCDILGVHEVNKDVISDLFDPLKYNLHTVDLPSPMQKDEPEFKIDGNSFIIKKDIQVLSSKSLTFSNNLRVAQILHVCKNQKEFIIANTHLDHLSDLVREQQLGELLSSLKLESIQTQIITGDFNFIPESKPYDLISPSFQSSHKQHHKKEAVLTFPTGLLGDYADVNMYGCFDYIWIRGGVKAKYVEVLRECGQGSIWASDHYPVFADLILE